MRALASIGVAVLAMTSCAVPSIVDCGDDRFCPAGSVCTPTGCSLPGVCGDGAIDDGELCDDGNRASADGCSAACIVEGCPNGSLDLGEECDDNNALSHDGCSSGCLVERPIWQQLMPISPPGPLGGMAAAWIPDRGRAILHGGASATSTRGEAWWWDGVTWTPAPSGPPPLQRHVMASDGGSAVVMFGGTTSSGGAATTTCWRWDAGWMPCVGPVPPARVDAAMAVGAASGEVTLYGGYAGLVSLQATWRRTASGWSDLARTGPPNASSSAMAYDPIAREHVLFGATLRETWTLDAAGWTQHADSPFLRDGATLVYDADGGSMVAFGGNDELIGLHNETVERDATGWSEVAVGLRPPPRIDHISFYDSIRRAVVIFGGYGNSGVRADTWILRWESATVDENCAVTTDADGDGLEGCADPDCWGRCDPRCAPRVSDCDPARPRCGDGTTVLVGIDGLSGSAPTWLLGTAGWTVLGAELPRYQPSMTYDPDRRRVVAFGGADSGSTFLDDDRELDLDRWSTIVASPRPAARTSAVMFHDAIRRGVVLFGGSSSVSDDVTWIMRWESATPDELCTDATADIDGDALAGCADPDC